MNKKVLITYLVVNLIFYLSAILVFSLMDFSKLSFRIALLIIGSSAVINLILIAFFEYKINKYKAKKFSLILHGTIGVISVAGIYILNYADNYDEYKLIYILSILGALILSIIVFTTLNYLVKEKPKKVPVNKSLNK